jgi:hypothetical protein
MFLKEPMWLLTGLERNFILAWLWVRQKVIPQIELSGDERVAPLYEEFYSSIYLSRGTDPKQKPWFVFSKF